MKEPKIVFILGNSGSGKGTQAKLLQERLGLDYIGSGDMLRARKKLNDFTGRKLRESMDKDTTTRFAPTAIVFKLWVDRWEAMKEKPEFKGFILDASPRKIREAELLDEMLEWFEWKQYVHVIFINVSREEAFHRLTKRRVCQDCKRIIPDTGELKSHVTCDTCGGRLITRDDDIPEMINNRLDSFEEEVMPVIAYYEKSNRLTRVNGEQSIEDVYKDIIKAL